MIWEDGGESKILSKRRYVPSLSTSRTGLIRLGTGDARRGVDGYFGCPARRWSRDGLLPEQFAPPSSRRSPRIPPCTSSPPNLSPSILIYLHSQSAILQDNHSFASELPPALSESWNLPLLELLDLTAPEEHTITLLGESEPEDQVEDVVLESPREDVEDIPIDTDLRVDSQNLEDAAADAQVAMRLRGGATVEEEEEEGDCDSEGEDEDEVELGCLKAMSATWDVDLSVGKVGGVPRWIDPESPLRVEDVTCSACSSVMAFLLQVRPLSLPQDDILMSGIDELAGRRT
jgi:hypothetical protein